MHRAPQVSPAGFCVCVGRTQRGKVCKNWGLFAFPRGGRWPAGPDEGDPADAAHKWVAQTVEKLL